jgi:hypothetical protein
MRPIHRGVLLLLLALSAASGYGQVNVTAKLDQPDYLAGEPVFVTVDVTNIGMEALGYAAGNGHVDLTVPGGQGKPTPSLRGFYGGEGSGSGGGVFDPPRLAPGQTVSDRYLLKGYRLQSGVYQLRASGRVGATWNFGWGKRSNHHGRRRAEDDRRRADVHKLLREEVGRGRR